MTFPEELDMGTFIDVEDEVNMYIVSFSEKFFPDFSKTPCP